MAHNEEHSRPLPWPEVRGNTKRAWTLPLVGLEWCWEWVAYWLSRWHFLQVVNYLRSFGIIVAVLFYFAESGDRLKQKHYQAWQVINTAQGKGGNGGRLDALQELNEDRVELVGVDVSGAFLQGLRLEKANLARANFNAADVRNALLPGIDFSDADLRSANFRECDCRNAVLRSANLSDSDFSGARLAGADFTGAALTDTDLRGADLRGVNWQRAAAIKGANIAGVQNAPEGFVAWAKKNGAVEMAAP